MKLLGVTLTLLFAQVGFAATTIQCGSGLDKNTGLLREVAYTVASQNDDFSGLSNVDASWTLSSNTGDINGASISDLDQGGRMVKVIEGQSVAGEIGYVLKITPSENPDDVLFPSAEKISLGDDVMGPMLQASYQCVRTVIKEQ
ncbi:MAG TPA: hypothetical protein VM432_09580 [Bdellovibrionales bacterium]|jgi:hypothetical protein|nr:hypothetical protein [Bdellovibrionales bacterium]